MKFKTLFIIVALGPLLAIAGVNNPTEPRTLPIPSTLIERPTFVQTTVTTGPTNPPPSLADLGIKIVPGTWSFTGVEVFKPKGEFSACAATPLAIAPLPWSRFYCETDILAGLNLSDKSITGGYAASLAYQTAKIKAEIGIANLFGSQTLWGIFAGLSIATS